MGLNATVTPGLTVTSSTVLSAANLNLLGTPTVSITGAIDSSDIGSDTVGTSELINNSVTIGKMGQLGGQGYIVRGDVNGVSESINTKITDKTTFLVNDGTTIRPRYVSSGSSLEVTIPDGNTTEVNLTIKENSITSSMLASDAAVQNLKVSDIQPGCGLGNGGVASTSSSAKTGGMIVFSSADQSDIGGTDYYGKAVVLQPSGPDQFLKSTGTKGDLTFGTLTGYSFAQVQAYDPDPVGHNSTATTGVLTTIFKNGVAAVRRRGITHNNVSFNYGILRVYFSQGSVSSGENIGVMGNSITGYQYYYPMPLVVTQVGFQRVNETTWDDSTDTNDPEYGFVDIKFVIWQGTNNDGDITNIPQANLRNPNFVNMQFFKY